MNTQVTVILPPKLYREAKRVAEQSNLPLEDVVVRFTQHGVEQWLPNASPVPDPDVEREKNAYLALHPQLYASIPQQHVAIYQGELVDQDADLDRLWARVEANYPDVYVWVTTVDERPIQSVNIPSIRVSSLSA